MKLLAIETSTLAGGVALMDDERLIAEYRLDVVVHHSERILSAIDYLLKETKMMVADVDAIAISIGPGSFTGLRVGLATAKGLAIGQGLPLVLVPTLEALAAVFPYTDARIAPFIDARRQEVYWALFESKEGKIVRCHPDEAAEPGLALQEIGRLNCSSGKASNAVIFLGDGAIRYREMILKVMPDEAFFPPRTLQFPSAAAVAELGLSLLEKGEVSEPALAVPLYVRASTPELKMKALKEKKTTGQSG